MPRLKALGYSVSASDHRFFEGPGGWGLIQVLRPRDRWFPKVFFIRMELAVCSPAGFVESSSPFHITVFVPRVSTQDRILGEPIPYAPSPYFSVEPLSRKVVDSYVALGVAKSGVLNDLEFTKGFPSLGIEVQRMKEAPKDVRDAFAKVDDPRLIWFWYLIHPHGAEPCAWVAAMIYLGLRLADKTKNNVRDMHMFTAELVAGVPFPSAQLWTNRKNKRVIVTVTTGDVSDLVGLLAFSKAIGAWR